MKDYLIYQRLTSVFKNKNISEELNNEFIVSISNAIASGKINKENLKTIEQMSIEEIIDFNNDQLRLF
jgi:hypothetical protein